MKRASSNEYQSNKSGVDPIWRKIDINKKFQRPTNGYKSDGAGCASEKGNGGSVTGGESVAGGFRGEGSSVVCSKVLAAQCGYASDYGSVRKGRQSGYRSDYSTKSRKSGYRSDYSVKGGCGYRSDCSVRRKLRRKRRPKNSSGTGGSGCAGDAKNSSNGDGCWSSTCRVDPYSGMRAKATVFDEQDLLQLAGLSLGNSSDDESGNEIPSIGTNVDSATGANGTKRGE